MIILYDNITVLSFSVIPITSITTVSGFDYCNTKNEKLLPNSAHKPDHEPVNTKKTCWCDLHEIMKSGHS